MKDRIVEHPNRYRLVKTDRADVVDLIPEPGGITEVGTLVSKATLLSDETARRHGGIATVDDALRNSYNGDNYMLLEIDLRAPNTEHAPTNLRGKNFYIQTQSNMIGGKLHTLYFDIDGTRDCYLFVLPKYESVSYVLVRPNLPFPYSTNSVAISADVGTSLYRKINALDINTTCVYIANSSGEYLMDFAELKRSVKSLGVSVIGGGAAGDSSTLYFPNAGGGKGALTNAIIEVKDIASGAISVVIGAGGAGVVDGVGNAGGNTSLVFTGIPPLTALGGARGKVNVDTAATSGGTKHTGGYAGGDGGASGVNAASPISGGFAGGGDGRAYNTPGAGYSGVSPGAGGGGARGDYNRHFAGGNGYQGVVEIRVRELV